MYIGSYIANCSLLKLAIANVIHFATYIIMASEMLVNNKIAYNYEYT